MLVDSNKCSINEDDVNEMVEILKLFRILQ